MHKYKLKYKLEHECGNFEKESIKEGEGATDALLIFSLLYPEDGSYSQYHYSIDGRNNGQEISDNDLFKIWTMLTKRLSDSKTLANNKKAFAGDVFKVIREAVLAGRG
jgi:hypothetical protein